MKKYLKKILCGLVSVVTLTSAMTAFAQTSAHPMGLEWRSDYSDNDNPKLIVTFKPTAQYTQQVIVVVYPTGDRTLTKYVRMEEVAVKEAKTTDITFNITNKFYAGLETAPFDPARGAYTVEVQGNGHLYGTSNDTVDVHVIKQGAIEDLLDDFRDADENTLPTVLDKVMPALQLQDENGFTRKEKRITSMIGIRTSDFNGEFSNLENVRDAWHTSDILVYIGENTATENGIKEKLISNSKLLGIDTTDADFVAHTDELCQDLLAYDHEYNDGAGVQSLKDLKDVIGEVLGTIAVNNATENNMTTVFNTYMSYFNISEQTLEDYNGFSDTYQSKALRDLYNKDEDGDGIGDHGFSKASELVSAFEAAVSTIKSEVPPVTPPPVADTPSKDSNDGSALPGTPVSPTTPVQPPATASGFRDVSSSHWANEYIEELASKNIIGGYDDGTFKPNNSVTREEFVKMIIGAAGLLSLDKECNFADVPNNAWYYDYVASAYATGIISGVDDAAFGIGTNITRQDVAVIAARVLAYLGKTPTATTETTLTDVDTVADYATDSVKLLNSIGIINGYDDGSFMPNNTLTRAEAATIICKLINSL